MRIIPCGDRFEELVQFVVRLNSDEVHHIGFFGEGEADVRASLAECLISPAEGFFLAYDQDRITGVFGVDADFEINRAWLYGPLVDHADWHTIADRLYAEVLTRVSADIRDRELFCDVRNINMHEFAARNGFLLRSENAVMTMQRVNHRKSEETKTKVSAYQEKYFEQFEKLHKVLFPNAYFTARQITEKLDETHRLFLVVENNDLLGYHFCKIDPSAESGYVDFIGTDESVRGRGIGADMLAAGLDWMLSATTTEKVSLTVNADNVAAIKLYEKNGFVIERVMRGYRKTIEKG